MSHYRDLNKELVEQVQTMRKNMKLYCDEIVYLKGELMQKHETEVILRKRCYNWALNSFVQLIQSVQPDSEILPVLEEHIYSGEGISSTSNRRRHPRSARISDVNRRSSPLTREFQRSNSIINLRKSVCSTSPMRRSNNESSDVEEEQNSQTMPSDSEEMENAEKADSDAAPSEMPLTTNIDNIILEESEEEEEEIYNCEDIDDESFYESVEEVSMNISEKVGTLNDITNVLKSTTISSKKHNSKEKTVIKKFPQKKTKKKNVSSKENSSDEYTTSKEDSDIEVTKKLTKIRQVILSENSSKVVEEETLQEPRRYTNSRDNLDTNKSFPFNQNCGQISNNEVTLNSTTLVLNDMTLKNFKDAACSTPNSRQNSLEATLITEFDTVSTVQTSSNTSSRPSRHCKPKNLAEQPLRRKLRNESGAKSLVKDNRIIKSKRKTKK